MKKLFSRKRNILIGFAVIFIILFLGFKDLAAGQKVSYQTVKVEQGTIISSISVSGQILNANFISVLTQASGVVNKIYVHEGDFVKKGDIIAEVDLDQISQQKNAQAWSNYLSAQSAQNSAQATAYSLQSDMFTEWKTFYETATNSTYQNSDGTPNDINRGLAQFHIVKDDWLAAEAKYKNQQTVINQTQAALQNSWLTFQLTSPKISVPMDGKITNLTIVEGMNINNSFTDANQSQRIAVIQNERNPLASFNLSEIDVNKAKLGQKVTLKFDSMSGKIFTGKVVSVDRIGSITSGVTNYPAIIQFDTSISDIVPNMAVNAEIIIDSKNDVLIIPSSGVQTTNDNSSVKILRNGKEVLIPVQMGLVSDTQIEIISGLKEGDEVITKGQGGVSPFGGSNRGGTLFRGPGR